MRILMLNYEFPPLGGGASPVSYEIAKGLVELGHSVDVVTMGFKGLASFECIDGINVYRVRCLRSKKEICKSYEMLSYVISARLFLGKFLKKHNYDICHCHFIIPTGIVALWVKKKFGIEYVLTSHGSDVIGYNKRFDKIYPFVSCIWKKVVRNSKIVTTPSLFLQKEIKKILPEGEFVVIPNGIDTKKFKPLKKEKIILVVARLFVNKGIQDILDALEGIDLKGWRVQIVGDGPYRSFLKKKCKENGLTDKVEFLGWIDNDSSKMRELYGKASVFVSASYFESFGISVIEALASGCYPLLSDISGHRTFVSENKYYFSKGSPDDLRTKLINLFYMDKLTYNKNISKYDWNIISKRYNLLLKY